MRGALILVSNILSPILSLLITFIEFELNKAMLYMKFPLEMMAEKKGEQKKKKPRMSNPRWFRMGSWEGLYRPNLPEFIWSHLRLQGVILKKHFLIYGNTGISVLKIIVDFVSF